MRERIRLEEDKGDPGKPVFAQTSSTAALNSMQEPAKYVHVVNTDIKRRLKRMEASLKFID